MMVEPEAKQQMLKRGIGGSECSNPEVYPKRARMESGSGSSKSGSPEDKKLPPQGKIINITTQNFAVIKNMRGFVDHTHFIRNFLSDEEQTLAIFAPRRFGKSSHLNMMKTFLSCVNERTCEPHANMNHPHEERENYELFKETKIIKDGNCNDILEKHLGKHPVIHLDFKGASAIKNVKDAKNHFREAVRDAYNQHSYLITSQKLCAKNSKRIATAQLICASWCDENQYKNQDLVYCLRNLSEYLYNHFDGARVYVLVDEFDAINASALRNVNGEVDQKIRQVEAIANVVTSSLCRITKGGHVHVAGALITGVSYIAGIGYSPDMNNFKKFRFLEGDSILPTDKDFVPFYGATEVEVRSLVEKLVQDDQLVNFKGKEKFLNGQHKLDLNKIMLDLESRYNGYLDKKGRRIFCLWSVLQYLQSGDPDHFWNQTDGIGDELRNIFRSEAIATDVLNLMHGKTITFHRLQKVHVRDLLKLQELFNKKRKEASRTVVFNFLMEQGYVSYTEHEGQFKMPNPEIRAAFSQMLIDVFENWDLDIMSCAEVINVLSKHEDEKTLQKQMLAVHKKLNNDLKRFQSKNPDHVNETVIMCALFSTMDNSCSFEFAVDSHMKVPLSSGRPDYLLLHKSSNFCILWELKHNKNEKMKNKTSKYALQEARGKEPTTNNQFKNYMKTVEALQLDALVIGLSVDGNFNVSLSYALNNEPKIFCITEKEKELHPAYYSDCIVLSEESD